MFPDRPRCILTNLSRGQLDDMDLRLSQLQRDILHTLQSIHTLISDNGMIKTKFRRTDMFNIFL